VQTSKTKENSANPELIKTTMARIPSSKAIPEKIHSIELI